MNPSFPDPDSWIDILDHIIIGVFLLLIAAVPTWLSLRSGKGIKEIKDQVVNGHAAQPNLREDIDRAIKAIEHLTRDVAQFRSAITEEVSHLRRELTDEGDRRRNGIAEVRADAERRYSELKHRFRASGE